MKQVSLQKPQIQFVEHFLQPEQLQRMLIYFSNQKPTDPHAQYGFTDVIVRLINDPLCIVFGQHGVYLFSNYLLVYPYNELDARQVSYITQFIRGQIQTPIETSEIVDPMDPSVIVNTKNNVRVTKQMGGGYTVRPLQLNSIRLATFDVLVALVRGIMCGSQKHSLKYRQHAINLQLQRILTKIVVSRSQLQAVNTEIESCMQMHVQGVSVGGSVGGSVDDGGTKTGSDIISDSMVECS
jgi:hypothetical protein